MLIKQLLVTVSKYKLRMYGRFKINQNTTLYLLERSSTGPIVVIRKVLSGKHFLRDVLIDFFHIIAM